MNVTSKVYLKQSLGLTTVGALVLTVSFSPAATAFTITDELTQLTHEFNSQLAQEVDTLDESLADSNISLLDVDTLFSDILPAELANTVQSCVEGPPLAHAVFPTSICADPENFLYFDEVHPTTLVHSRIADTAIAALDTGVINQTDRLFVFGDSFSDKGNVFGFSGGTFPFPVAFQGPFTGEPLYTEQAFTNGAVWWEYLTDQLSLPDPVAFYENVLGGTFPNLDAGTGINFAVGGATTGVDNAGNAQNPPFPVELPGLADQLDAYTGLIGEAGNADPDALYVVWAGGNNFLGAFTPEDSTNPFGPFQDFTTDPIQPVSDISDAISELYDLGARNFLVGNLYDLGATPLGSELELVNASIEPVPEGNHAVGSLAAIALFWGYRKLCRLQSEN